METECSQNVGAGIACIGMGGAGIGVGHIFGNYLAGALRNPSAAPAVHQRADRCGARGRSRHLSLVIASPAVHVISITAVKSKPGGATCRLPHLRL